MASCYRCLQMGDGFIESSYRCLQMCYEFMTSFYRCLHMGISLNE